MAEQLFQSINITTSQIHDDEQAMITTFDGRYIVLEIYRNITALHLKAVIETLSIVLLS